MKVFFSCLNFKGKVEIGALQVVYQMGNSWDLVRFMGDVNGKGMCFFLGECNKQTLLYEIKNEYGKVCVVVKQY